MPGFRPGIHEFAADELVDPKAKPWDDERVFGQRGVRFFVRLTKNESPVSC